MALDYSAFAPTVNPIQVAKQITGQMDAYNLRQQKIAEAQQALAKREQFQRDIGALMDNPSPTAADYSDFIMRHPEFREAGQEAWKMRSEEQRTTAFRDLMGLSNAIDSGYEDVALQKIREKRNAYQNAGDAAGAEAWNSFLQMAEQDPKGFARYAALQAMSIDPDKAAENIGKMGQERRQQELQPLAVQEKQLAITEKAQSIAKAARMAGLEEAQAIADMVDKGFDPTPYMALASDEIKTSVSKAAALQRSIIDEENADKRRKTKMEIQKLNDEAAEKITEKVEEVNSARENTRIFIEQVEKAIALGDSPTETLPLGVIGALVSLPRKIGDVATGPIEGSLYPILQSSDVANFDAALQGVSTSQFFENVASMRGMGALGEKEGARLEQRRGSLERTQEWPQLKSTLQAMLDDAKTAQARINATYPTEQPGQFKVTAPNGKTYTFPTQSAANQFKQRIGVE